MAGLTTKDIDVYEINEAFASQAIYSCRVVGIEDRYWAGDINPNGGAIALGHPLGCTGAKLTAQLLHELKRRNGKRGIVSMCIGGGMGAAAIYEMLGLALNAIWSDLLYYVKGHGRTPLTQWVESIAKQSSENSFWEIRVKSSIPLIDETEDQLVQDLFRGTSKAENGLKLAIKVLSRNDNLKVLDQILRDMELYFRIKEDLFSRPDDLIKMLLPRIAQTLLGRHRKVSELKAKKLWLDLDGDNVFLVDIQEMALGFHSYRFRQLESLIRDIQLGEDDLANDQFGA